VLIPPLDTRREDIPGIIWAVGRKIGIAPDRIAVELIERLARAGWPGGITEIETALREAASSTDGPLQAGSVQRPLSHARGSLGSTPAPDDPALARERLANSISKAHGSIAAAARMLGISRQAIYREAQRLGVDLAKHRGAKKDG
jgi:transcriptional regulator of acetoin/glycerol metabolism